MPNRPLPPGWGKGRSTQSPWGKDAQSSTNARPFPALGQEDLTQEVLKSEPSDQSPNKTKEQKPDEPCQMPQNTQAAEPAYASPPSIEEAHALPPSPTANASQPAPSPSMAPPESEAPEVPEDAVAKKSSEPTPSAKPETSTTAKEEKPKRSKVIGITAVFAVLIVAVALLIFYLSSNHAGSQAGSSSNGSSTLQEEDTSSLLAVDSEPVSSLPETPSEPPEIDVTPYIGYWDMDGSQETELTIHSVEEGQVEFTLWYYRTDSIEHITATLEGNSAYFLADDGYSTVTGTLVFEDSSIIVTITESTRPFMPPERMVFNHQHSQSWLENGYESPPTEEETTVPTQPVLSQNGYVICNVCRYIYPEGTECPACAYNYERQKPEIFCPTCGGGIDVGGAVHSAYCPFCAVEFRCCPEGTPHCANCGLCSMVVPDPYIAQTGYCQACYEELFGAPSEEPPNVWCLNCGYGFHVTGVGNDGLTCPQCGQNWMP